MYATILREFSVILFLVFKYSDALPAKSCKIPNGDRGECLTFDKCDPLYRLDRTNPKTPEQQKFLVQSVGSCSGGGTKPKVCCPLKSQWSLPLIVSPVLYPEMPTPVTQTQKGTEPVNNSVDNRVLDTLPVPLTLNEPDKTKDAMMNAWFERWKNQAVADVCGNDANSAQRIVGGNATEIDEYPWLALLEYGPGKFHCGGSLISKSHVVTAAHCLYKMPSQLRLAEYNLTTEPTDVVEVNGGGTDNITVTIMQLDWAVPHPDHKYGTSQNDIGVIKMKGEVEYGDFIKPICLPSTDYRNTDFTVTTTFLVAGWGSDNVRANSEVKRSLRVPFVPEDECMEKYHNIEPAQVMCAGGEVGKDSCRGDSGGPLMYESNTDDNTKYILVGVVSSGDPKCGVEGSPGVYTYVYNYVDWIKKTMKGNGNK